MQKLPPELEKDPVKDPALATPSCSELQARDPSHNPLVWDASHKRQLPLSQLSSTFGKKASEFATPVRLSRDGTKVVKSISLALNNSSRPGSAFDVARRSLEANPWRAGASGGIYRDNDPLLNPLWGAVGGAGDVQEDPVVAAALARTGPHPLLDSLDHDGEETCDLRHDDPPHGGTTLQQGGGGPSSHQQSKSGQVSKFEDYLRKKGIIPEDPSSSSSSSSAEGHPVKAKSSSVVARQPPNDVKNYRSSASDTIFPAEERPADSDGPRSVVGGGAVGGGADRFSSAPDEGFTLTDFFASGGGGDDDDDFIETIDFNMQKEVNFRLRRMEEELVAPGPMQAWQPATEQCKRSIADVDALLMEHERKHNEAAAQLQGWVDGLLAGG